MKIKIIYILLLLLIVQIANAKINAEIDVKSIFDFNETMYFDYKISSNEDAQVKFIPHIECPNNIIASYEIKTLDLKANQVYEGKYTDLLIDEGYRRDRCVAYLSVIEPEKLRIEKKFILNTIYPVNINVKLCDDEKCEIRRNIFYSGDYVFIDSDTGNANVFLVYPDNDKEKIDLPKKIKLKQIGTYRLEFFTTANNYNIYNVNFGVINKKNNFKGILYASIGIIILIILFWLYKRKQ